MVLINQDRGVFKMDIHLFDYNLPPERIAQTPLAERDASRMLVLHRSTQTLEHRSFRDLLSYLRPGDVLVRNNTRVIPARLFGVKPATGAHVEVLLLRPLNDTTWECLVGNARVVKIGTVLVFGDDQWQATCVEVADEGIRHLTFADVSSFWNMLDQHGTMPLPPYIHERLEDQERYQTVYSNIRGSAAAPTAGLHFTPEMLEKVRIMKVELVDITLHVGLGTFRPVSVERTEDHHMHSESYEISEEAAYALNQAKQEHRRIIAVGTTSTRTLEANYAKHGSFMAEKSQTNLFITPGYRFQAIDALITNFHLPKSTLLMLVSAFAGREFVLEAYREAVQSCYRFFSFGDAMFLE